MFKKVIIPTLLIAPFAYLIGAYLGTEQAMNQNKREVVAELRRGVEDMQNELPKLIFPDEELIEYQFTNDQIIYGYRMLNLTSKDINGWGKQATNQFLNEQMIQRICVSAFDEVMHLYEISVVANFHTQDYKQFMSFVIQPDDVNCQ
ncbi:hypothetical protein [Vibrio hyugaensis]|uniref:hypothetical protein n=1 Tax=Vibrio hyugaensis TaxID=1534743 RepID=UPI0005F06176|nr:hypothetical protein [Vibrio hyugaensis]